MLAAWPGVADVGLLALDHVRKSVGARPFAQIDMSGIVTPDSVVVAGGIARLPDAPDSIFHYHYRPDFILFESNAQIGGKEAFQVVEGVLSIANAYDVKSIYTADAVAMPMSHSEPSQLYCVANTRTFLPTVSSCGAAPMEGGRISGMPGVLLGAAETAGLNAACLLASVPPYATSFPYPKGSLEIVKAVAVLLGMDIDLDEIESAVASTDRVLGNVLSRIRSQFREQEPEIEDEEEQFEPEPQPQPAPPPPHVRIRIEELFQEVADDKSKAPVLKEELDRWGLFDEYEDRFLDLFSPGS
jgi:uncharacterized protein